MNGERMKFPHEYCTLSWVLQVYLKGTTSVPHGHSICFIQDAMDNTQVDQSVFDGKIRTLPYENIQIDDDNIKRKLTANKIVGLPF